MSDIAIRVEHLSKQYRIGQRERYKALRDVLTDVLYAPFRRLAKRQPANGKPEPDNTFWALKDVSFEIKRGELVGVIGRNGAGKSTLLKILSRITEPTNGHAEIHGRVGSLLEIGTGFHPELTGRENIFLNGAVLGMKRAEIVRKFDEIVAFAEVEKFIDTPVKHYSSGMHMRLAFSVAAHLEPEILLVDEVLAVGDAAFQKKCLGKMAEVSEHGRTVLLVTHQMNQIRRLCERCIWLENGQLRDVASTTNIVSAYEASVTSVVPDAIHDGSIRSPAHFLSWNIVGPQSMDNNILTNSGPVKLRFILKVNNNLQNSHHGIALYDSNEQLLWGTGIDNLILESGIYDFVYTLNGLHLRPGIYRWLVTVFENGQMIERWHCTPVFVVALPPLGHMKDEWAGILNFPYEFVIQKKDEATLLLESGYSEGIVTLDNGVAI